MKKYKVIGNGSNNVHHYLAKGVIVERRDNDVTKGGSYTVYNYGNFPQFIQPADLEEIKEQEPKIRLEDIKAGDLLEITAKIHGHGFNVGDVVKVDNVSHFAITASLLDGGTWWALDTDEVKRYAPVFEVGDLVTVIEKGVASFKIGDLLKVIEHSENFEGMVRCEYADGRPRAKQSIYGHRLLLHTKAADIKPEPVKEKAAPSFNEIKEGDLFKVTAPHHMHCFMAGDTVRVTGKQTEYEKQWIAAEYLDKDTAGNHFLTLDEVTFISPEAVPEPTPRVEEYMSKKQKKVFDSLGASLCGFNTDTDTAENTEEVPDTENHPLTDAELESLGLLSPVEEPKYDRLTIALAITQALIFQQKKGASISINKITDDALTITDILISKTNKTK